MAKITFEDEAVKSKREMEARKWIRFMFGQVGMEMQIGMHEFHFIYDEEDKPSRTVDDTKTLLAIHPIIPYKRSEIFISPQAISMAMDPKQREYLLDAIIHEVCHIHTAPIVELVERRYITEQDVKEKAEEVTETMAYYVRENIRNRTKLYKGLTSS